MFDRNATLARIATLTIQITTATEERSELFADLLADGFNKSTDVDGVNVRFNPAREPARYVGLSTYVAKRDGLDSAAVAKLEGCRTVKHKDGTTSTVPNVKVGLVKALWSNNASVGETFNGAIRRGKEGSPSITAKVK